MKRYLLYVGVLICLAGCDQGGPAAGFATTPAQKAQTVFNTSDKSIETNGNVLVAVDRLSGNSVDSWDAIAKTSAESISKSPYSALGKLHSISGKVFKVEEFPPTLGLSGQWSEVLMLADNQNSVTGVSTIDCIYSGPVDKIKSGDRATCSGYFIGTFDSQNALGGLVESYVFVGHVKK